MQRMKAWVYHPPEAPGEGTVAIRLEEVPVPRAGQGELLVRILKASVCGTDETLFQGGLSRAPDGVVPGHEFCGEVVEVGEGVQGISPEDVVAVESHYSLPGGVDEGVIGLWPPRDADKQNLKVYHGGYAEYACIPAECAHRLPPGLASGDFWPSLFEPAGNDFLLAREVKKLAPQRVAVVGCGPHGLYAQIFLKHFGIPEVVAFEKDATRAEFARRLGCASEVVDPSAAAAAEPFDVTLDMVGKTGGAFRSCCEMTRPGGTVVLFGLFTGEFQIDGRAGNDLIFSRERVAVDWNGKRLHVLGVTGREGIWEDLIRSVGESRQLQELLMRPVTVVGRLDELGEHVRNRRPELLKAAFHPFSR